MRKNNQYMFLLSAVLVVVIIWAAFGMLDVGAQEEKFELSVVVNNSSSSRYDALRSGMEQAARDYQAELNFVSTGNFINVAEEEALINREVTNGADGVILQMYSSDNTAAYMAGLDGIAVPMLVETDVTPESHYSAVLPDNAAMGQTLGERVNQKLESGQTSEKLQIGILQGNQLQLSMQQRLKGLKDTLDLDKVSVEWEITESLNGEAKELKQKMQEQPVDLVIALDNDDTETVADYLNSQGIADKQCCIFGIGNSEKNVYYLDQGRIELLLTINEFNMGYQSVEELIRQLRYRMNTTRQLKVNYLTVDRETMYEEATQQILFPAVQ